MCLLKIARARRVWCADIMDPSLTQQVTDFRKKSFASALTGGSRTRILKKHDVSKRSLPPQLVGKKETKKRLKNSQSQSKESGLKIKKARSRFSLLAAIVEFLKTNFFNNNLGPFTLDEILEATENAETPYLDKIWLVENALANNPRVNFQNDRLSYNPIYEISDKRSLYRLLQHYDENGLGGINLEDIRESVGNADHLVRSLRNHICHISRKDTEKDVIYFYDSSYLLDIDSEFIKAWKQVTFESMEDKEIEDELKKNGILKSRLLINPKKRFKTPINYTIKNKIKKPLKLTNTHLSSEILQEFKK
ncbi:hypothetical protein HZS_5317 [Henneguya salminicola]|uniref:Transcription initiation factor IIE subunit beta n=1 Tax=Henneguya salminicola TaxID=69463 RepID=A0A6G3MFW6_HENSL|nr:hypothetical protein HZS_5317 [Henneguya salminicola]